MTEWEPAEVPEVSVITATHNPDTRTLPWLFEGLAEQTLPSRQWEFILVDNASEPPVDPDWSSVRFQYNAIPEPRLGLAFARSAGIRASRGRLIVFLDDDNRPEPRFLEEALDVAARHPGLGCFGGIAEPYFEAPPPSWVRPLLPYLGVRNAGDRAIRSRQPVWGPAEPIGAGMVFRREVGLKFADWVASHSGAGSLGRKGASLISGEDTVLARFTYPLGMACGYEPGLRIRHWMKPARLRLKRMISLLLAQGRSYVRLCRVEQPGVPAPPVWRGLLTLCGALLLRLRNSGIRGGLVEWMYDWGRFLEWRRTG